MEVEAVIGEVGGVDGGVLVEGIGDVGNNNEVVEVKGVVVDAGGRSGWLPDKVLVAIIGKRVV